MTEDVAEEPRESEARRFFEALGLSVERIPTADEETPDYRVTGDGAGYLIEVKGRLDDSSITQELDSTGVVERTRPIGYSESITRAVRKARGQLETQDATHELLWLVWLSIETEFASPELTFQQILSTLYGIRSVIYAGASGDAVSGRCYYARPGPFERWPEIDGALISTPDGYVLCANEFSPRANRLLETEVGARLSEREAIVVPRQREARGQCFIADLSLDRRDENALTHYLREEYARPGLVIADFKEHSVTADVKRSNLPHTHQVNRPD